MNNENLYEKTLHWLKNQRPVVYILLGFGIYMAFSSLMKTTKENYELFSRKNPIENDENVLNIGKKAVMIISIDAEYEAFTPFLVTKTEYEKVLLSGAGCIGKHEAISSQYSYEEATEEFFDALEEFIEYTEEENMEYTKLTVVDHSYIPYIADGKNCKVENMYIANYTIVDENKKSQLNLLLYDNGKELKIFPFEEIGDF